MWHWCSGVALTDINACQLLRARKGTKERDGLGWVQSGERVRGSGPDTRKVANACVAAIHMKKIGIRSRKDRKNRAPPEDVRRRGPRPVGQAPRPGGVGGGPGGVGGGSGGTGGGAGGGFGAGARSSNTAGGWPQN